MEDSIEKRKNSEEAKYKLDAEMLFKAKARRNKLLGLWAAGRMGMTQEESDSYAREVVRADIAEPGVGDVVAKVAADAKSRNLEIGEDEIKEQLERLYGVALEQIGGDYPDPLGPNHGRVGD